jgi:hypothetical protein
MMLVFQGGPLWQRFARREAQMSGPHYKYGPGTNCG